MNNWLFNIHDPNDNTRAHVGYETRYDAQGMVGSMARFLPYNDGRIVEQNNLLLQNRVIVEPQVPPSSDVTIEELKAMRLVGVYEMP